MSTIEDWIIELATIRENIRSIKSNIKEIEQHINYFTECVKNVNSKK